MSAALLAIAVMAGCSGGTDNLNSQGDRFLSVFDTLRNGLRPQPELPNVTRALLDGLTVPSLEVTVPDRDGLAYLIPLVSRNTAQLGPIDLWTTADGSQLSLRSGVILATRGVGDDVTSSDKSGSIGFVTSKRAGTWPMSLYIQTSAEGVVRHDFTCTGQNNGKRTLEIVELTYPVDFLTENCSGRNGQSFQNEYYVDTRDGTVWQTKQWAGEKIGYMNTRILKKK
ncbi:YjbF family lipoprotein [Tateyamaria sp. SN6-1]|uniref:YjbF family lipoprotein n=1 Tax=Tateyamaria sp. SN6-1 TaxID=3092148 RepID=UPI0039F46717